MSATTPDPFIEAFLKSSAETYAKAILDASNVDNLVLHGTYSSLRERVDAYQKEVRKLQLLKSDTSVTASKTSPEDRAKYYTNTYPFYKGRTKSLAAVTAILEEFNSEPTAVARRFRSTLAEIMRSQEYLEPMATVVILMTSISGSDESNAPIWLLCHWFQNRVPATVIYNHVNWLLALPDTIRKRMWTHPSLTACVELSAHELAHGDAIAAACFPVPTDWPEFKQSTSRLLTALLTGAGASTTCPPGTYPSAASAFVPATSTVTSIVSLLRGAGYSVPVVDGMVDLTQVELHFGQMKAEIERLRRELADTRRSHETNKKSVAVRLDGIAAAAGSQKPNNNRNRGRGGRLQGAGNEDSTQAE